MDQVEMALITNDNGHTFLRFTFILSKCRSVSEQKSEISLALSTLVTVTSATLRKTSLNNTVFSNNTSSKSYIIFRADRNY
jgi:hypothetical protein